VLQQQGVINVLQHQGAIKVLQQQQDERWPQYDESPGIV
jgi:hypothetical protein